MPAANAAAAGERCARGARATGSVTATIRSAVRTGVVLAERAHERATTDSAGPIARSAAPMPCRRSPAWRDPSRGRAGPSPSPGMIRACPPRGDAVARGGRLPSRPWIAVRSPCSSPTTRRSSGPGFRAILEAQPGLSVVGEAADGLAAVDLARRRRPAVVLMDIRMPGSTASRPTRRSSPTPGDGDAPILMLTTFDHDAYVYDALRAGASGFLLKDAPPEQLIEAVRIVAAGDGLIAPAVTKRLIAQFARTAPPPRRRAGFDELTPRELEVLGLVARGRSNAEIADGLVLSEATVKSHLKRILAKLGARDRVQAVVLAYEAGLVSPGAATDR